MTTHRHRWVRVARADGVEYQCDCQAVRDETRSARGRTVREYGNRAELKAARKYGGTKTGHHGGPVDIVGHDFNVQVRTHRRLPPKEWTTAFAAMPADKLPRLLMRFVFPGGPRDFFVIPGDAWLSWYGKDEVE